MLAKTYSATHHGIDGVVIEIEASRQRSLPQIHITGLPGEVVKESRERVRACLVSLGFDVPSARIVVHLSPAHARKQGSQFDLGIAVSVLIAEEFLRGVTVTDIAFLGELSLDGRLQRIAGAVALIQALEKSPFIKTILLPRDNEWEANVVGSRKVRLVGNFGEVLEFLQGNLNLPIVEWQEKLIRRDETLLCLDDVIGHPLPKRALQIAIAGRHHLLLIGPPGVGKSLLAHCAPALLPPLNAEEVVEVAKNHGHALTIEEMHFNRPFRSPHHSISGAAFLGGGSGLVIPGEVTLAHTGVLFLDEFPEFRKDVIEGLREPLQTGRIHLHRVGHALTLPARFTLIVAMNPCPCGYSLSPAKRCVCSWDKVAAYRKRISGAILDRIDLYMVMFASSKKREANESISHQQVRDGILRAFEVQRGRFASERRILNGDAMVDNKSPWFELSGAEKEWFEKLAAQETLSFRSLHKILKVARTIADIDGNSSIQLGHLRESWGLRCPESFAQVFGF